MARVLIVDDERSIRLTLRILLRGEGYEVEVAEDADEARDFLLRNPCDVVLSDIVLPRVSGVALLKEIRASAPEVQVIMMTGEPTVETAAAAVRGGAADYLVKPVSKEALLRSVGTAAKVKVLDDERRRLEKANQEYQAQLERQNIELREAAKFREEVEAVNRHDLKSPLNVIIAAPELVRMTGPLSAEQANWITQIEEAGRRMLSMINLSLDLFRMEKGYYRTRFVPVDAAGVVLEVMRHQEETAHALHVSLKAMYDGRPLETGDVLTVQGERLLLYSLLGNLVKNAIEASPAGGAVSVALRGHDQPTIVVRNSGEVPAGIRDRFFGKFITQGKERGTGLGAYSAKLMTEIQGGTIRLDASEPGQTGIILTFQPGA
jgi:two-component system, sensor histidine kinase and response regulator